MPFHEVEDNEEPPESAVAIEKRVNGLELAVQKSGPDQQGQLWLFVMNVDLPVGERRLPVLNGCGTNRAMAGLSVPIQFCETRSPPGVRY